MNTNAFLSVMVFQKINAETLILQGPVFFFFFHLWEQAVEVNPLKWDAIFAQNFALFDRRLDIMVIKSFKSKECEDIFLTGYISKGTTLWNKGIMVFLSVSDGMWVMNM